MSGARFVRFYPSDWRSGCIGLTPEEEGVYMRVCAHFWETGVKLALDDADAASRLMLDVRMWRRIKAKLISKGKLHVAEDGVFNPRAERELTAANRAAKKEGSQTDMGAARGSSDGEPEDRRNQVEGWGAGAHPVETGNEVAAKSERSPTEVAEIFANKRNENNGPISGAYSLNLSQKENQSVSQSPEPARANGQTDDPNFEKCKLAFNGSTNRLIDELKNAEGPYGTKARAAEWLADTLDDYGAAAILDAFKFLERCRDEGQTIRDPRKFISKNAQRYLENKAAKKAAEVEKKANLKPTLNRLTGEIEWRKPYEPYVGGHA